MAGVFAFAVFYKRPKGQLAGVVGYGFADAQSQVIAFHIGIGPCLIAHTAAAHGAEDRTVVCGRYCRHAGDTAPNQQISPAVKEGDCSSLGFDR